MKSTSLEICFNMKDISKHILIQKNLRLVARSSIAITEARSNLNEFDLKRKITSHSS